MTGYFIWARWQKYDKYKLFVADWNKIGNTLFELTSDKTFEEALVKKYKQSISHPSYPQKKKNFMCEHIWEWSPHLLVCLLVKTINKL